MKRRALVVLCETCLMKYDRTKDCLSICTLDTCSTLQVNKGVLAIADVCEVLAV